MAEGKDDIPIPRLRAGWDGSAPDPLVTSDEARAAAASKSWRHSRTVPVVVAVVTTLILSSLFSDIDLPRPLLLAVMVLLLVLGIRFRRY